MFSSTESEISTQDQLANDTETVHQVWTDEGLVVVSESVEAAFTAKTAMIDRYQSVYVPELQSDRDRFRDERDQARRDLLVFKDQVREVAIDVRNDMGWCLAGLNERLEQLGLEPVTETWDVSLTATFTVTVDTSDEGDAGDIAHEMVSGWFPYGTYPDITVDDVDPA